MLAGPKKPPISSPTIGDWVGGTAGDQLLKLVSEDEEEVDCAQLVPIPILSW